MRSLKCAGLPTPFLSRHPKLGSGPKDMALQPGVEEHFAQHSSAVLTPFNGGLRSSPCMPDPQQQQQQQQRCQQQAAAAACRRQFVSSKWTGGHATQLGASDAAEQVAAEDTRVVRTHLEVGVVPPAAGPSRALGSQGLLGQRRHGQRDADQLHPHDGRPVVKTKHADWH